MQSMINRLNPSDRFIPYRSKGSIEAATYFIRKEKLEIDLDTNVHSKCTNPALVKWKKKLYQTTLSDIMELRYKKILNIPRTLHFNLTNETTVCHKTWPVHARKKPLIESPITVLNMPDIHDDICHHVTDWGRKDHLAFLFEEEVYIWQPKTKKACIVTSTGGRVRNCVRWTKSSTKLAVGLSNAGFAVLDCKKNAMIHEGLCLCTFLCNITCLEWSSDNYLLSGCSNGRLSVWSSSLQLSSTHWPAHNNGIISITLSCNERYLATTGTDSAVRIWFWPNMVDNFEIKCASNVRGIAWHPWRDSLFAIGGSIGEGSINLWSASSHQQIAHKPAFNNSFVDALTWNCITGELVVSYWHPKDNYPVNPYSMGKSSIVVFSDLNTEVDVIEWHSGNVLYLLWGSNGTRLGTAGLDEKFCVWDFLGTSVERENSVKLYKNRYERKPHKGFKMSSLTAFGQTIR